MRTRPIIMTAVRLGICAVVFMHVGCAMQRSTPHESQRRVRGAETGEPVTSAELDELTRAFADRYVGLLYSVCEDLKTDNPDAVQRREAQTLLLDCSTNVYDIASNADAFTRVLDLVVVTSLLSHVWVDDGRANAVFGERGDALARAMSRASAESRVLAARVLTDEQLGVLDALLRDWRAENPDMVQVSFIRFSNFAIGRGTSAVSHVLAARGQLFAEIGHAGQAVDEARLLGERMFYRFKREPTLLRWQAEAIKDDFLATPQFATALVDLHRLTDQIEQLPVNLAAERQATLAGVDDALQRTDATVANVKATLDEAHALVASLDPAGKSLSDMFVKADTLFGRFEAWDRWKVNNRSRPFDIREYTAATRELAVAAEQMNEALTTSSQLLASPEWGRRFQTLSTSADERMTMAADQSRRVLNAFFWRACALLGVLFVMLLLYRWSALMLTKRFAGGGAHSLTSNKHADQPNVPGAGKEGRAERRQLKHARLVSSRHGAYL